MSELRLKTAEDRVQLEVPVMRNWHLEHHVVSAVSEQALEEAELCVLAYEEWRGEGRAEM